MSELQVALAHATRVALLVLLVGVSVRGRARLCWSFPVYALAILAGNSLTTFWPDRFYTAEFYVLKQAVYDILKMAMALELAWRALEAFPGALRTARLVLLGLLGLSTVGIATLTPSSGYLNLSDWQPRTVTTALWLLTATALLVVWYQVPVHPWPRAIMLGLAPYLLVFALALDMLKRHDWATREQAGILDSTAYLVLLLFWNRAAWRRDAPAAARPVERAA
jgi:hypothetical protein